MTATLLVFLGLAVREDIVRQRIPNSISGSAALLAVIFSAIETWPTGFVDSVAGAAVGCAAMLPFYLQRGMGAGDVKLMGAAGAFLGPKTAFLAAALALVAGFLIAMSIIVCRIIEARSPRTAASAADVAPSWRAVAAIAITRKERFPYAVAIAAGVIATLWLNGLLSEMTAALGIG